MNFDSLFSGQNRHTQALVLHESLVERHQFKIACLRERCQIRLGPNVRRKCEKLHKDFQRSLYVIGFVREGSCLLRPSVHQSARWLDARCREKTNGPMGTRLVSGSPKNESSEKYEQEPSRLPLQAATSTRRVPQHHFELHLEFPCVHYRQRIASNQVEFRQPEAHKRPIGLFERQDKTTKYFAATLTGPANSWKNASSRRWSFQTC